MNNRATAAAWQQGMSLIEMMIAMTISLLVIGAVSGVYLSTSRSYTQDELISRMQENARYALHVLAEDLSMVGYWGPMLSEDINNLERQCPDADIPPQKCTGIFENSSLSIGTDCGPGAGSTTPPIWAYSTSEPLEYSSQVASRSDANADYSCIGTGDDEGFLVGSDILVVKRVEATEYASSRTAGTEDGGNIFMRTDGTNAMLFEYQDNLNGLEGATVTDWRYRANIYYIRDYFLNTGDGIPTLVRKTLTGNVMDTEDGGVAQGIEQFHVMFGVDDDNDGDTTADYYTANPIPNELDNLVSARIYVLARSAAQDFNYQNDKTYRLGDLTRTFNDNFYRRVFTTTVSLRNPRNRRSASGS